jgi:precorrin-2 dehydrogenase/sirohydrochlorin ferrochelatase
MLPHYPVFIDLSGRLAVVVGDGAAVERKVHSLLRHGADVAVISPDTTDELRQLEADGRISVEPREYQRGDLAGAVIVLCVGASEQTALAVFSEAESLGCLVNVAGSPELCNFLAPSTVRRGPLQFAVSTRGLAPSVAKRLRLRLKEEFGEEWGTYVTLLGDVRALAFERIEDADERERVLAVAAEADILERLVAGDSLDAEGALAESRATAAAAADATADAAAADATADAAAAADAADPEE